MGRVCERIDRDDGPSTFYGKDRGRVGTTTRITKVVMTRLEGGSERRKKRRGRGRVTRYEGMRRVWWWWLARVKKCGGRRRRAREVECERKPHLEKAAEK